MKKYVKFRKFLVVLLLCASILGVYQPRRASATEGMVFLEPALQVMVVALMAEVGLVVNSDQGASILSADYWRNLPAECIATLTAAYAASQNGVAQLEMTTDLMNGMTDARDTTVAELDAGTEYTVAVPGDTVTVDMTGILTQNIALGEIDGMVAVAAELYSSGGNQVVYITTSPNGGTSSNAPTLSVEGQFGYSGGYYQKTSWYVAAGNNGGSAIASGDIVLYRHGNIQEQMPNVTFGATVENGVVVFNVNGTDVYTSNQIAGLKLHGLGCLDGNVPATTDINWSYALEEYTATVLDEGTDYTYIMGLINAVLDQNSQLMGLIGTTMSLPTTAEGDTSVAIPVPGTVTIPVNPASDLTGVTSWLSTIWNSMVQGINGVVAGVNTLIDTITGFFDITIPVDWSPLRSIGTGFSSVFPFSLPWDLNRMLGSFNASEWNGQVPISAHSVLANFDFLIDFSMFDNIRGIVKVLEVVAFDIGLILITRKLLGGAA